MMALFTNANMCSSVLNSSRRWNWVHLVFWRWFMDMINCRITVKSHDIWRRLEHPATRMLVIQLMNTNTKQNSEILAFCPPATGGFPAMKGPIMQKAFPLQWRHNECNGVSNHLHSGGDQRKHQSSASLAFVRGIHRDQWIPRTKGQLRGKCFHLMTSSWLYGKYYGYN